MQVSAMSDIPPKPLLLLDATGSVLPVLEPLLVDTAYTLVCCDSVEALQQAYHSDDILLIGSSSDNPELQKFLLHLHKLFPEAPIIFFSDDLRPNDCALILHQPLVDHLPLQDLSGPLLTKALSYALQTRRQQAQIRQLRHTDSLTGLNNRHYFYQSAQALMRSGDHFALFMLDIDNFSQFNLRHSTEVGDEAIFQISQRLQNWHHADLIARTGNDEFALIVRLEDNGDHAALLDSMIANLFDHLLPGYLINDLEWT